MEQLETLCQSASAYPLNFSDLEAFACSHTSRSNRLNKEEHRLFCAVSKASIDLLEYGEEQKGRLTLPT